MEPAEDIKTFLQICIRLLRDPQALRAMQNLLENLIIGSEGTQVKRYTGPTPTKEEYIYKLTVQGKGSLPQDDVLGYKEDTEDPSQELEVWQNWLGEASTL